MTKERERELRERLDAVIESIYCSATAESFIRLVDDLVSTGSDPETHGVVRRWLKQRTGSTHGGRTTRWSTEEGTEAGSETGTTRPQARGETTADWAARRATGCAD